MTFMARTAVKMIVCLVLTFGIAARGLSEESSEERLAKINQMSPEDRQAALVAGAKKEQILVWYAGMNRENLNEFINAFQTKYPFLKVKTLTIGGTKLFNRALTEYRAGQHEYDIINVRSSRLYPLKQVNAVMRYKTPYRKALKDGFYDKEGYFNAMWASVLVFMYNTNLVTAAGAPHSLDDLLDPKWKGKLGMDTAADDWMTAVLEYYGDEKGKEVARSIGNQNLQIRHGRSLLGQLVAAGEIPVEIDAHQHEVKQLRDKGAPVSYVFPKPFIPIKSASALTIASHAPHPYAAALLVDFMISKEGQEIVESQGRWPAHKGVSKGGPDDVGERKFVLPDPNKWGPRFAEVNGLVKSLLQQ